jgi:hypothetical protein
MARATSALGNMAAAASSGFAGMLPITHADGPAGAGASRRIKAIVESLTTRKGLNLRLAPAITQAFEGAELKASDYAKPNRLSKESAARELRQAVEAGLLQLVVPRRAKLAPGRPRTVERGGRGTDARQPRPSACQPRPSSAASRPARARER